MGWCGVVDDKNRWVEWSGVGGLLPSMSQLKGLTFLDDGVSLEITKRRRRTTRRDNT
jgi:hypothetical protein